MRFEARETIPQWLPWLAVAGAGVGTMCFAAILIATAGASPLAGFKELFIGAFGSRNAITETGATATPLIFTGLAAAIAFRAKFWNIGAEGQLYAGALAVIYFGTGLIELPSFLMIPFLLIVACVAGGLTLLPMVLLRQFMRVDEVVTTLLTNFVIILLVSYLLDGPWKDPYSLGWPQSAAIIDAGVLPQLVPRSRLHLGFAIAVASAIIIWLVQSRTVFGFSGKAVGLNQSAARHAGIPVTKTIICIGLLSGGMAGLAGAGETIGLKGYLTLDLSPGFGYTGIAVAMLGNLHPIGVIFAAIFIAIIYVGADAMSRAIDVPTYLADVIVATTVLAVLIGLVLVRYRVVMRG
jgi:simple sugar transport system permease protein